MAPRTVVLMRVWALTLSWAVALALLPWWIGFPLLLGLVAVLLFLAHRLTGEHRWLLRHGLRWGLPGALFALQRALGGNIFGWIIALLGMLTGYTLLAGLEAWLDRDKRRAGAAAASGGPSADGSTASPVRGAADGEWSALALAPVGPPAEIIELQCPLWHAVSAVDDPHGGCVRYRDGAYRFDDGTLVKADGCAAAFSPDGRWFAAGIENNRGTVLRDRQLGKLHRLRGWRLYGWHREQPWLTRRDGELPLTLRAVLGDDAVDE